MMKHHSISLIGLSLLGFTANEAYAAEMSDSETSDNPNVVIVITDDQGKGDLGCLGNEIIQTPHLDRFYEDAVRLTNFHVSPTSAPTRAALMTGRYTNRTNCFHTVAGRSLLFKDEKILSQVFANNGYATGMFGKWHLGDNYPFRPEDRGFQEVVRHGGGGVTQAPDYWGNTYFDDTYWHNSEPREYEGYCTDVFFDEALRFIENKAAQEKPFLCYISTNAPHGPLNVPEEYYNMYKNEDRILEPQKRFYGMITNIDDNFKRLQDKLQALNLTENTILIFMTDNGTAAGLMYSNGEQYGHDGGLRGKKGSEYDGGHCVPFFIRWPDGEIEGGKDVDQLTAHIDVLPTLRDLCGLKFIETNPVDGKSLVPLLKRNATNWENRMLITDSQRKQNLVKWRKSAVMDNTWRLVNGEELYNIEKDPYQENNVASAYPEVMARLKSGYNNWWNSLVQEGVNETYAYIQVGTPYENPVRLSSHDMITHGTMVAWHQHHVATAQKAPGILKVEFARGGKYRISLRRYPRSSGLGFNADFPAKEKTTEIEEPMPASKQVAFKEANLYVAGISTSKPIDRNAEEVTFEVEIPKGKYDMEALLLDEGNHIYPSYYTYVEYIEGTDYR